MAKSTASCPNCRQPVLVELTRLFDTNLEPDAKQRLISGNYNLVACQNCGYQGNLPSPIVYHDPENELLLSFFPPEMGVPVNEQEKMIGPLIKKAVDGLPMEKRKAYLFRPQTMLTMQRLIETILEKDGITPEMLKAQQDRLNLIQRLAMASADALPQLIQQEEALIDEQFFMMFARIFEATAGGGDEKSLKQLAAIQQQLLLHSATGRKLKQQAEDSQMVAKALQEMSQRGLSRQDLLKLALTCADNETKLTTLVGMARGGMDYGFFQMLSEQIDQAAADQRAPLVALRDQLLALTHQVDESMRLQAEESNQLIDALLAAENIEEATYKTMPVMNAVFMDQFRKQMTDAKQANDFAKLEKLTQIAAVIQKATVSDAYMNFIDAMMQAENDQQVLEILNENKDGISQDLVSFIQNLIAQLEGQKAPEQAAVLNRLKEINRLVLRFTMTQNMNADSQQA